MAEALEIYTKGTRAWFKDEEEGYVTAILVTKSIDDKTVKMTFSLEATGAEVIYEQSVKTLEDCKYEELPALKNPPKLVQLLIRKLSMT